MRIAATAGGFWWFGDGGVATRVVLLAIRRLRH